MVSQPIDPIRIRILNGQMLTSCHVSSVHGFLTEEDPNWIRNRSRDSFRRIASQPNSLDSPVWIQMGSFQLRVSQFLAYPPTVQNTEEMRSRLDRSQRDPHLNSSWMAIRGISVIPTTWSVHGVDRSRWDPPTVPAQNHECRIAFQKTDGRPRNSESATANN
jgi:hypothetical protein